MHFGDSDFEGKYRTLLDNIGQWRATAGRVESVDLRFSREAVVNPENTSAAQQAPAHTPARGRYGGTVAEQARSEIGEEDGAASGQETFGKEISVSARL